jgi:uncharacterized repeat protein (TIGR01451 family)
MPFLLPQAHQPAGDPVPVIRGLVVWLLAFLGLVSTAATAVAQSANCGVTAPSLRNGGFEAPPIGANAFRVLPTSDARVQWRNTAENYVEVWSTPFQGVSAYEGSQFAELNANLAGTLYQSLATIPGTQMVFSLAHKARTNSPETMEVLAGPDVNHLTSLGTYASNVNGPDHNGWTRHGGTYSVPPGQTATVFAFRSRDAGSGGNLLDAIEFTLAAGACNDTAAGSRGAVVDVPVLANDIGAGLTVSGAGPASVPTAGTVAAAGSLVRFTPAAWSGVVTIPYTIRDAAGVGSSAFIKVTVNPIAVDDSFSSTENRPQLLDVLANDGATAPRISVVTPAAHGTVTVTPDGLRVTYTPAAGFSGTDTFTYFVTADPSGTRSRVATATVHVAPNSDVAISQGPLPATIGVGQVFSYPLTITNHGPSTAMAPTVTFTLPVGVTLEGGPGCTSGPPARCTIAALSPGGTYTFHPQLRGSVAGTNLSLTATVSVTSNDPVPGNDSAIQVFTVQPAADLAIVNLASGGAVPGGTTSFTLDVHNDGPSNATGNTLELRLIPAVDVGVPSVTVGAVPGACLPQGGGVYACPVVDLANGASTPVSVTAAVGAGATAATIQFEARITGTVLDPDPTDNQRVIGATVQPDVDLAITGRFDPAPAPLLQPGQNVLLVLDVMRAGASDATGTFVRVALPAGLTLQGALPAECTLGVGEVVCQPGTLTAGAQWQAVLPVAVATSVTGAVDVAASVSSAQPDANAGDNAVVVAGPVNRVADRGVVVVGATTAVAGDPQSVIVGVFNTGPADAGGTKIDITLPTSPEFVLSGFPAGCTGLPDRFTCTLDLAPASSTNVTLNGTWAANVLGPRTITATLLPPTGGQAPDPNPVDDTSALVVHVSELADLALSGDLTTSPLIPGRPAYFSLAVTNQGPSAVPAGARITLPLPTGLAFVSATGATCAAPGTDVLCDLDAIGNGQTRGVVIEVLVGTSLTAPATTASVAPPAGAIDPNPANDAVTLSTPSSDVSVSAVFVPPAALVGAATQLVVTVTNAGPARAPDVEIATPLPAGLTSSGHVASAGVFTPATGMWQVGSLDAGTSATLTVDVSPAIDGPLAVAITETSGGVDIDPSNDSTTAMLNAVAAVDLQVSLKADRLAPAVGETVTLSARVVNAGPSPATQAVIALSLPAGLSVVSVQPTAGVYVPGTWTIPTLGVNGSATLTLVATVTAPSALGVQAACVSSHETEVAAANNVASVVINGALAADVQVTKQVSTSAPAVGQQVTYTVVARNNGPSPATGLVVTDVLDARLAFVSAVTSTGAYDSGTGTWTVGDLRATQQATLTITATVTASGQVPNVATKVAMAEPDPVPANDSGAAPIAAGVVADLSVVTAAPASVSPGLPITYSIAVTNAGPNAAAGAAVQDHLSAFLLGATWTCTPSAGVGVCRATSGTGAVAALVDLEPGAAVVFTVRGTVSPSLVSQGAGVLDGTATVSPNALVRDPDPLNNRAALAVLAGAAPIDLVLDAFAGPSPVLAGSPYPYVVTVRNNGPADATAATLTVTGPAGVTITGASPACHGVLPCALPVVPAGGSVIVTVDMTVSVPAPPTTTTPFTLQATVTAGAGEIDLVAGNETAVLTVAALDSSGTAFSWLLPEGVSTDFFSTRIVLFNPGAAPATVIVRPLPEGHPGVPSVHTIPASQRLELDGVQVAGSTPRAYGTAIESDQPIAVERTTSWDATQYGAHGDAAIEVPAPAWYFAEGATGGFDLFFLLANPGLRPAVVEARFLPARGLPIVHTVTVPAGQRVTLWANTIPGLEHVEVASVFTVIDGPPIGVSRAMYTTDALGRRFGVGHTGVGLTAPATRLTLSEAAAGYFDLFFLLGNPDAARPADVRLRFGLEDGTEVTHDIIVPAAGRENVWINALAAASADPLVQRLGHSAMTTTVESRNGVPVVVDRAMYWPVGAWLDGTATSANAAGGAARWAVADAEVGGPHAASTFLLVGNQATTADTVAVTLHFDDGTTAVKSFAVAGGARLTVWLDVEFPQAAGRRFGAVVESLSGGSLVVERSSYGADATGRPFATGVSVPATRLP